MPSGIINAVLPHSKPVTPPLAHPAAQPTDQPSLQMPVRPHLKRPRTDTNTPVSPTIAAPPPLQRPRTDTNTPDPPELPAPSPLQTPAPSGIPSRPRSYAQAARAAPSFSKLVVRRPTVLVDISNQTDFPSVPPVITTSGRVSKPRKILDL